MSQTELSSGLICRGTDTELLMSDADNWKGIENIDDFDDCHNNWVEMVIERNCASHFEIGVASSILLLTTEFDWHYGQPNEDSRGEQILVEFSVLLIHRNDDDNPVVWLGDFYESSKIHLKVVCVGC